MVSVKNNSYTKNTKTTIATTIPIRTNKTEIKTTTSKIPTEVKKIPKSPQIKR